MMPRMTCVPPHMRTSGRTQQHQEPMSIWNQNMQGLMPGLALCDSVCQAPAATTRRRQGGTPAEIALGGLQRCAMPGQSGMPVTLNRPPTEAQRVCRLALSGIPQPSTTP